LALGVLMGLLVSGLMAWLFYLLNNW
jgi:hypothetical protein